jgi:hypothetical protein
MGLDVPVLTERGQAFRSAPGRAVLFKRLCATRVSSGKPSRRFVDQGELHPASDVTPRILPLAIRFRW